MSNAIKTFLVVIFSHIWPLKIYAQQMYISTPVSTNINVCSGELISLSCTHSNFASSVTRWRVVDSISNTIICDEAIVHASNSKPDDMCGEYRLTMVSDDLGTQLTSSLEVDVRKDLFVECLDGGGSQAHQVRNVTIKVINTPIVNRTLNVRVNQNHSTLEWDPLGDPDYQRCITGYSISWDGGQYDTTDASTSVSREVLHKHGFPYCQTQTVTVTPLFVANYRTLEETSSNITFVNPDFSIPLKVSVTEQYLTIQTQMSSDDIFTYKYGLSNSSTKCIPDSVFNKSSILVNLTENPAERNYTICVVFQTNDCIIRNSTNIIVSPSISDSSTPSKITTTYNKSSGLQLSIATLTIILVLAYFSILA